MSPDSSTPPSPSPHLAFTTVSNIKSLIPITLSLKQPNYKKWKHFFLITTGRFGLKGFLDGTTKPTGPDDDDWQKLDYLLQSWIYATVSDDVSDIIISPDSTAHDAWTAINNLFNDNKKSRAMHLEEVFRNTLKGASSISEYCQTMKNLSDALADVDAPLSEEALVLQTLRGLPDEYKTLVNLIPLQKPFPTFLETRSLLTLEENRQAHVTHHSALSSPSTALTASSPRPPPSSPQRGSAPWRGGRGGRPYSRGHRGRGRFSFSRGPPHYTHSGASPYNFQPGILGPGPQAPHLPSYGAPSQAHLVMPNSPAPTAMHWTSTTSSGPAAPWVPPPSPAATHWPSALLHSPAMPWTAPPTDSTMTLRPPSSDWYMDSGASSHMTSHPGSTDPSHDSSVQ